LQRADQHVAFKSFININKNLNKMILGKTIRVAGNNLKNGYFVKNKNGFQIVSPTIQNNINLYCKVHNGKLKAAIELYECPCTGHEKILATMGNYKIITKHFNIK
jgi:hypothetical protein